MRRYIIEDAVHAQWMGEFDSLSEAGEKLERLAELPFDESPNLPPCSTGAECERIYEIRVFDTASDPWDELRRERVLTIDSDGAEWLQSPEEALD